MSRGLFVAIGLALVAGSVAAGCGSDEFGPVGEGLPTDVDQDSLRIELDPPASVLTEVGVTPVFDAALDEREILYLGRREQGGWLAVPMFRFDFTVGLIDTTALFASPWDYARIELQMLLADAERGIPRTLEIYELADTLRAEMAEGDLAPLLGERVTTLELDFSPSSYNLDLPRETLSRWIRSGGHTGVAVVDASPAPSDTLVGFAGKEFTRFASLLAPLGEGTVAIPKVGIEADLADPNVEDLIVTFPILRDLTHFERDDAASPLSLGSHLPRRCWLEFDLSGQVVPSNATINRAILNLHVDSTTTLGVGSVDLRAYRATQAVALGGDKDEAEFILRGSSSLDIGTSYQMEVDVTEFVQRAVNDVLDPGDGILLALNSEELFLRAVDFHGSDAVEDSLRPRLEITFTPPADFQE